MRTKISLGVLQDVTKTTKQMICEEDDVDFLEQCAVTANEYYLEDLGCKQESMAESVYATVKARLS